MSFTTAERLVALSSRSHTHTPSALFKVIDKVFKLIDFNDASIHHEDVSDGANHHAYVTQKGAEGGGRSHLGYNLNDTSF